MLNILNRKLIFSIARRKIFEQNTVRHLEFCAEETNVSTLYVPGRHGNRIYQIVKPLIDVDYIVNNIDQIKQNCELRKIHLDPSAVKLTEEWKLLKDKFLICVEKDNELLKELKRLQSMDLTDEYNTLNEKREEFCATLKIAKDELYDIEDIVMPLFNKIPNVLHPEAPREYDIPHYKHEIIKYSFEVKSHVDIGCSMSWLEFSSFSPTAYFLTGKLSLLENAIQCFFYNQLLNAQFIPMSCVDFCKSFVIAACGKDSYSNHECIPVKSKEREAGQRLNLVGGSSFEALCAYFVNMNIHKSVLPAKYFSLGRHYNAQQKDMAPSLFSVIQSTSIQCLTISDHTNTDDNFEAIYNVIYTCLVQLNIPFRIMNIAAKNLNATESRRIQFELWSPFLKSYIPCGSVSQRDDFISRRLQMTYGIDHQIEGYLNVVDGVTIVPVILGCLIENFQNADGTFHVTDILQKHMLV